jgi:predicted glycosyltransferase
MRILIDVGHPADVHLFRYFYHQMISRNHVVLFTVRKRDVTVQLLDAFNLNYITYGKHYKNAVGKLYGILKFDTQLYKIARQFKPDLFISLGSFYASHVAFFMRKLFITFEDTGNMEQILLYKYFADAILTPDTFSRNLGKNHLKFKGFKELAYLHPHYFKPSEIILNSLGLKPGEKFVLLRFVGWNASHDIGHNGISHQNKQRLINQLERYARVFISSESELPIEFRKYQLNIPPEEVINVMNYASLFYGESATMASECAMIGTPSIFVNNANISYTQELEIKYDLVHNFTESPEDQEKSILKALELIRLADAKSIWKEKQVKMMNEQIDLNAFLVWFVENYPESRKIMKETPDYQYNF